MLNFESFQHELDLTHYNNEDSRATATKQFPGHIFIWPNPNRRNRPNIF